MWWLIPAVRKGQKPPWMVPDGLWERIEPLLPVVPRRAEHPGRKRLDDRKVLCGVLFVLYTGIPWEFLPQELGFGSGMTCWRRLRDWHEAGVRQHCACRGWGGDWLRDPAARHTDRS
jgi:transposase